MNWLKIIGFVVAGPIVAALNNAIVSNSTGMHVPITAGTVVLPGLIVALKGLAGLFTGSPLQK